MDGISLAGTAASPFQGTRGVATGAFAVLLLVVGVVCVVYALRTLRKTPGTHKNVHHPQPHPKDNPRHRDHRE